jgi:glutamate carboxypeptidase
MSQSPPASLSSIEQRLVASVAQRAQALLEDLRLHVGIPTGGGNAEALDRTRQIFAGRLAALGATTTLMPGTPRPDWLFGAEVGPGTPPTLYAKRIRPEAGPRLLLGGHLDTVHDPRGPFQSLSISPDGKTAVGPGCVDMKGGLVIAVAALEVLEECGVPCSWSFVMNSDEETGTFCSDAALRAAAREHDVGLIFEPALPDGSLVVERPGSGQFMVECTGKTAHVGRDFASGVSAVTALAKRLVEISTWPDASRGLIVSVGPIEGGRVTNAVPDWARAWGNVRYPDPAMVEGIRARYDSIQTPNGSLPGCVVHATFNRPAKPRTPQVERLAGIAQAAAGALGQPMPLGKTGGVCDGNNFQAEGLPTIDTLGVRGGGLHTPQEWIDLPSLVERCQLLTLLISRLSSGREKMN